MKIKKRNIIMVLFAIVLLLVLGILLQLKMNQQFNETEQIIVGGWTAKIGDEIYEDVDLSWFKFPDLKKGEIITLTRTLYEAPYSQTVLHLHTQYSAVLVSLNGEIIYENGNTFFMENKVLGNGFHWIALPDDFDESTLQIVIKVGEKNAFTSMENIKLMNSLNVFSTMMVRNLVTCIIACCLLAVSVISILSLIAIGMEDSRFSMLLWLGLFSGFISVWMMCSSKIAEGLTHNLYVICNVEYISMYSASVCMMMFVAALFKKKKKKHICYIMGMMFLVLGIVLTALSLTNIIHYPKTVRIFHIAGLIATLMIIHLLWQDAKNKHMVERIFMIGSVCFLVSVILEMIRYQYNKIVVPANLISQSAIPIGAMVFIISMFASFFLRIMERVAEEIERKQLYDMAYQDSLTGLKNRAWCKKIMKEFEDEKKPLTLINMDLNLFKMVNDTYGHAVGDELLVRFSKILSSVFRDTDCVARMGGDEFVILVKYITDDVIEEHMQRLFQKIETENKKDGYPYKISVSYGYASDPTGDSSNPWKVYELADQKMYEDKNSRKDR